MFIHKKALYNTLFYNLSPNDDFSSLKFEPWQAQNYRSLSQEELFAELGKCGLPLNPRDFSTLAKSFHTPEELSAHIVSEESASLSDHVYLILFEIWRRLLPQKQSPSLVGDELDYQIDRYLKEEISSSPKVFQNLFSQLEKYLDHYITAGVPSSQAFIAVQTFSAYPLESFLFHYISDQLDEKNIPYAKDLIKKFGPFVSDQEWVKFLSLRLEIAEGKKTAFKKLEDFFSTELSLDLSFQMLSFLAGEGLYDLFVKLTHKILPQITQEEDFQTLLSLSLYLFETLSLQSEAETISSLLQAREKISPEKSLSPKDKDLTTFKTLLYQKMKVKASNPGSNL